MKLDGLNARQELQTKVTSTNLTSRTVREQLCRQNCFVVHGSNICQEKKKKKKLKRDELMMLWLVSPRSIVIFMNPW